MNTVCTCIAYLMLIIGPSGERDRPIEFDSKGTCESAKPTVRNQYPSSERHAVKLTCIKK